MIPNSIVSQDVVSGLIQGYRFFTENVQEMVGLRALMSCFKTFSYLLLDAAYNSIYCFCILRKETAVLPIIDINRRMTGKDPSENDIAIRWLMKSIRAQYKALYKKRWENREEQQCPRIAIHDGIHLLHKNPLLRTSRRNQNTLVQYSGDMQPVSR